MRRLLIATILGVLALAPAADAKYLHLNEAKSAAHTYLFGSQTSSVSVALGSCWRGGAGPHLVQCGATEVPGYSAPQHVVVVIALRGDRIYGHIIDDDEGAGTPRFITKL